MKIKLMAAVAAAAAAVALSANAGTPALTYTGGDAQLGNGPFTLGWEFTTSQAFRVDALGAYDSGLDGLVESHDVGLWDNLGNLLASTTIASGTGATLVDNFRYNSIASVLIGPGTYFVGALWLDGGDPNVFPGQGATTTVAGLTYVQNGYATGGSLADPTQTSGEAASYFGANLQVGNVPEPMTWALMLVGFGGMGAALRARRRAVATA
jgi:hypothetical protein